MDSGPLSAVGVQVQPYDYAAASGVPDLAENAALTNTTVASLYGLLSGVPLAPELVLGYARQLVKLNPTLRGTHGLFDSASHSNDGIDVREMYLAIHNGSTVIGMTGAGQIGMRAYLNATQDAAIQTLYADKDPGVVAAPEQWPQPDFEADGGIVLAQFDGGHEEPEGEAFKVVDRWLWPDRQD